MVRNVHRMEIVSLHDFDKKLTAVQRGNLLAIALDNNNDRESAQTVVDFHRLCAARMMRNHVFDHAASEALRLPITLDDSMEEAGDKTPGNVVQLMHRSYLEKLRVEREELEQKVVLHIWQSFRALLHELGIPMAFIQDNEMRDEFLRTISPQPDSGEPIGADELMAFHLGQIMEQYQQRLSEQSEWLERLGEFAPAEVQERVGNIVLHVSVDEVLRSAHGLYTELLNEHNLVADPMPQNILRIPPPDENDGEDLARAA